MYLSFTERLESFCKAHRGSTGSRDILKVGLPQRFLNAILNLFKTAIKKILLYLAKKSET